MDLKKTIQMDLKKTIQMDLNIFKVKVICKLFKIKIIS